MGGARRGVDVIVRWGPALVLALAVACRGGASPRQAPATAEPLPPTAAQPDRPLLGPGAVTLAERLRIAPQGRWRDARDLEVDGQGNLFLLDAVVPARILKFDSTGHYLLRLGQDEPQPKVFQAQKISLAPAWNSLLVVDRAEGTVSAYLTTLGMLSYAVQVSGGTAIDALGLPGFGEYYLHGWDPARGHSSVYHMRMPADTLATTYEVAIPLNESVLRTARAVYFRAAVDRRGRLYVGFYDGYPVRVLEPSGRSVALLGIDRKPVPRSAEAIAAETAENLAKLREQAPDLPDSLLMEAARPDSVLPVIDELVADPAGRLWVRTHRADAAGRTPYDVFNEEGRYLARVDVPGDVRATAFGADGRLFVLDASSNPAGAMVSYEVRFGQESGAPAAAQDTAPGARGRGRSR